MSIQLLSDLGASLGTFSTIQAAVDAAVAGNSIHITAGTYEENISLTKGVSLIGIGDVIIDGGVTGPAIAVSGGGVGQGILIDNIDLVGSGSQVIEIVSTSVYDSVTLQNGAVEGGDYHGLFVSEASSVASITLTDLIFSGNATTESGGSGESAINFYKYNGDINLANITVENPGSAAENGIQMRGGDPLSSMGVVSIDGVNVSGSYAKTGMAIYNYTDTSSFSFGTNGLKVDVIAGWLGFNADNIGGVLDLSSVNVSISNSAPGAANDIALQGSTAGAGVTFTGGSGHDFLSGKAGNDVLNGAGGDDVFLWTVGGGRDVIDGGTETGLGDTFTAYGDVADENFDIYSDVFLSEPGNSSIALALGYLPGSSEFVVARNGSVISQLTDIENIMLDGVFGDDTYTVHGDLGGVTINAPTLNHAPTAVDDVITTGQFSEFLVNEFTFSQQIKPSITMLPGGGYVIVWQSSDGQQGDTAGTAIKARVFDVTGTETVSEFLVNEFFTNGQGDPSVVALSNGSFVVTWMSYDREQEDTDSSAIKARIFDAQGIGIIGEFVVNGIHANAQDHPSITALASGGFVVSWRSFDGQQAGTSGGAIKARVFDANGVETVSEFLVNEFTDGIQDYPSIVALSNGGFVVTWQSDDGQQGDTEFQAIKARIFNASGVEVVGEFLVNEFYQSAQREPAAVELSDGRIAITWISFDGQQGDIDGWAVKARIFDTNGIEVVGEFLVNEFTSGTQVTPSVTALSNGNFVVTWQSNDGQQGDADSAAVKGRIFNSQGIEVVGEFLVNELVNGFQGGPSVAALPDGGFVVTWQSNDGLQGDTDLFAIKARTFNADGTPRVLGGVPEDSVTSIDVATLLANDSDVDGDALVVSAVAGTSANGATLTLNNDGTISYDPTGAAAIQALAEGVTLEDTFTYTVSDGQGGTDTATVTITIVGTNDAPIVAIPLADQASDEDTAVNFTLPANAFTDVDGTVSLSATLLNGSALPAWLVFDAVAGSFSGTPPLNFNGDLAVLVTASDGITSISDGFTLTITPVNDDPVAVDDVITTGQFSEFRINEVTVGNQLNPSMVTLSDGRIIVAWMDQNDGSNDREVKARILDSSGTELVGEFLVNEFTANVQDYPTIAALSSGGFIVVWHSNDGQHGDADSYAIKARMFDADGVETVSEFLVNEYTGGSQTGPFVTALSTGGFAVSWRSSDGQQGDTDISGIKLRIFDANGLEVVSEFLVNEFTNGYQSQPFITSLSTGGFVVSWTSADGQQGDASSAGVKARIFDANGIEIVSEFLVNEYTNGLQSAASVAALSTGGFVVSWSSEDGQQGDSSSYGIKARIFDANGIEIVSEFLVNEYTNGSQTEPSVTALSTGGFVVSWRSADGGPRDMSGSALKARIFDANGIEVAGEFLVNEYTEGSQLNPVIAALPDGGFVVTWQSNDGLQGDTDLFAIKARTFNADGTPRVLGGVPEDSVTSIDVATLLANDSDVDGDALVVSAVAGTSANGATLTLNNDGTISYDPTAAAAIQALAEGVTLEDTFTYTVSDGNGGTDTATVTITIVGTNDAPVIDVSSNISGFVTESGDLAGIREASVVGGLGHVLTLSAPALAALNMLQTSPDALAAVLGTVQAEIGGDLAIAINVLWDYLDDNYTQFPGGTLPVNEAFVRLGVEYAAYLEAGGMPFIDLTAKFTADGSDVGSSPDRMQSVHDNLLGNLNNVSLVSRFTGQLLTDLTALVNDVNPDLINRPVYSGNEGVSDVAVRAWDQVNNYVPTASGQLVATDADQNATQTWSVNTTAGTYGTLALNAATGAWMYQLDDALPATQALELGRQVIEIFTATVVDDQGSKATVDVTITVLGTNDAPIVAIPLADQASDEDTAVNFTLPANAFTDVDGTVNLSATLLDGSALPAWLVFDAVAGSFSGTPPLNFNGDLAVLVTASDGIASVSDGFTLSITPVNDAPVASDDIGSGFEDSVTSIDVATLLANDSDVDGDALAVSAVAATSANGAALTLNPDGTISYDPTGAAAIQALAEGVTLEDTFTYTVSDGNGGTDTATVTITIVGTNDAPIVAIPLADQASDEDTAVNFTLPADAFTDVDGTVSLSATLLNGSALPAWLVFDAVAGSFSGTPPLNFNGDLAVLVTASDGITSISDGFTLTITPVNDAPVAVDDVVGSPTLSEFLVNEFTANDQQQPAITTLANGNYVITWHSSDRQQGDVDSLAIKARIFDASGVEVVSEFLVNEFTAGFQIGSAVTAMSTGGFIVTWRSSDGQQGDTSGGSVKARVFDANGVEIVSEFRVNEVTNGNQSLGSVAELATGNFVYTWVSVDQQDDTSGASIKARILNANGIEVVSEFLVNEFTNSNQAHPVTTVLSNGNFVVTWQSPDGQQGDTDSGAIKARIFSANGVAVVSEFLVNEFTNGNQIYPVITSLATGGFVIAWESPDGQQGDVDSTAIKARIFNANGVEVVGEFLVNQFTNSFQNVPSITALANGGFVATWQSYDRQQGDADTAIKARVFDANGIEVVSEFLVNEFTQSLQGQPSVTASSDGGFVVTWLSRDQQQGDTHDNAIKARMFDTNGVPKTFGGVPEDSMTLINTAVLLANDSDVDGNALVVSAVAGTSANGATLTLNNDGTISYDPTGAAAIQALAEGVTLEDTFTYTVSDGQGGTDTATVTITIVGTNDAPIVAIPLADQASDEDTAVNFTLPANAFTDVDGTVSLSATLLNGSALPAWLVFDAVAGSFSGTPPLNFNGDLAVLVTASDGITSISDGFTLTITPVNDDPVANDDVVAAPILSEFQVNEFTANDQRGPAITTLANGNYVVTWQSTDGQQGDTDGWAVKARILDPNGVEIVSEFLVNEFVAGTQGSAKVTAMSNGGFVVSWGSTDDQQGDTSGSAVKARIFDPNGVETVSEFRVNELINGNQNIGSVAELTNGHFIYTWTSKDQQDDTSGFSMKARILDANGVEIISEFLVNEFTNGDQFSPIVAALSNGNFVVSWISYGLEQGDTQSGAIKARIFNANGVEVVSEFLVNEFVQSNQSTPSITALSNGGFVVSWESSDRQQGDTDGTAIKARIFDASGVETVSEFVVNEFTNGHQFDPSIVALVNGGFVATWESYDQQQGDTSLSAIKARVFDANGIGISSEFRVNEYTEGYQLDPEVAALPDGGFVITWSSQDGQQGDTQDYAIKSQAFNADGTPTAFGDLSEDVVLSIDVATLLANDSDVDGDALAVSAVAANSANGAALTLNLDGTISYDPTGAAAIQALAEGVTLEDTFTYTVSDGQGGTDTATVTITIVGTNDAPMLLIGTAANEILEGAFGDDIIDFGTGTDVAIGGAGNDTFIFKFGYGADTITDFSAGAGIGDVVEFDSSFAADYAALQAFMDDFGGADTVIDFGGGDSLTLHGATLADLHADDFRFVA